MQEFVREVRVRRVLVIAGGQGAYRAQGHGAEQHGAAVEAAHGSTLPPVIMGGSTLGTMATSSRCTTRNPAIAAIAKKCT